MFLRVDRGQDALLMLHFPGGLYHHPCRDSPLIRHDDNCG